MQSKIIAGSMQKIVTFYSKYLRNYAKRMSTHICSILWYLEAYVDSTFITNCNCNYSYLWALFYAITLWFVPLACEKHSNIGKRKRCASIVYNSFKSKVTRWPRLQPTHTIAYQTEIVVSIYVKYASIHFLCFCITYPIFCAVLLEKLQLLYAPKANTCN